MMSQNEKPAGQAALLNRTIEAEPGGNQTRRAGMEERRCFITRWCSSSSR
jgi:hypothetical protein